MQHHDDNAAHTQQQSSEHVIAAAVAAAGAGWLFARWRKNKRPQQPSRKPHAVHAARTRPMKKQTSGSDFLEHLAALLSALLPLISARRIEHSDPPVVPAPVAPTAIQVQTPPPATVVGVVNILPGPWWRQASQFTRAAVDAWFDDFAPSMGAAIAYYTMFSIAPILVIAIAVAGMMFGEDAARGEIVGQIQSIVGIDGAMAVQLLLKSVDTQSGGIIATVLSVITLAVGATAVFSELQSALDRIWKMPSVAKKSSLWTLLRTRLLSFGLILGLGFMLMASLVVSAALAALGKWWGGWFTGWEVAMQAINFVVSFFVFTVLFSAIYRFMPRVSLSWHDVRIGAMTTTVLFMIGKSLIGLYLGKTGMSSGFGAAGSFALLLAWIYYSAQIFLLGAEFTWIYANNFGSRKPRL